MALESLFGEQGNVVEARVIFDRDTGRSKGFGFVTLGSPQEVTRAINSLNGAVSNHHFVLISSTCEQTFSDNTFFCLASSIKDLDGRQIRVSEAEARPPRRQF